MNKKPIFLAMLVVLLALSLAFVGCKNDDDGGGAPSLDGTWSQPDNTAIRFSGGNLQSTGDITSNNVNWTMEGTYTFNSPTLTITPPPQNGVVQNAVQGTAVINGIQLIISGFPYGVPINGNWTKQ